MCQFIDKDFYLIFRSIDLLVECNDRNQLGFDKDVIIKNSSFDIFEHLYNSVKTAPYMIYREKIDDIRFKNLIEKFDCSILPLSYKIPAILIKAKLPKTAFLLTKVLTKL